MLAGDRLDQQSGDRVFEEGLRQTLRRSFQGTMTVVAVCAGGDPRAGRDRQRRQAGAGVRKQAVGVTVVGAGELDDDLAAGYRTGEADGAHRRLGAGAGHPQHLHRRDPFGHLFRQLHLGLGGGAEAGPAVAAASTDGPTTPGWAWPRISGPQEPTQST